MSHTFLLMLLIGVRHVSASLYPLCELEDSTVTRDPGYEKHQRLVCRSAEFPPKAEADGVQGSAVIEITIDVNGKTRNARVVASGSTSALNSYRRTFESSAIRSGSRFRYRPSTRNGQAVESTGIRARFNFVFAGEESEPFPAGGLDEETYEFETDFRLDSLFGCCR